MVTDGPQRHVAWAAIFTIGLAVSFANPIGIAASIAVPALVAIQPTRQRAFIGALLYYGGASWALIPAATGLLGRETSALLPIFLWCSAAFLLAAPWALLWTPGRRHRYWRVPVALVAGIVPPLGLIGWASPLTAAGLLFPGAGWFGLVAATILSGCLAVSPRPSIAIAAVAVLISYASYGGDPKPPSDWQGINTEFGAGDSSELTAEYLRARTIQEHLSASDARVIVFPESVLRDWTETTDVFWAEMLTSLRHQGKTVLIGATSPRSISNQRSFDFSADLKALTGTRPRMQPFGFLGAPSVSVSPFYRNTIVVRGATSDTFDQRIPVPIAMWKPFTGSGVRLNVLGRGATSVAGTRVAILVCYEQLLAWSVLSAVAEQPDVLVAIANIHLIAGTPIPACQTAAVRSWGRLFRLPIVSAVNS